MDILPSLAFLYPLLPLSLLPHLHAPRSPSLLSFRFWSSSSSSLPLFLLIIFFFLLLLILNFLLFILFPLPRVHPPPLPLFLSSSLAFIFHLLPHLRQHLFPHLQPALFPSYPPKLFFLFLSFSQVVLKSSSLI